MRVEILFGQEAKVNATIINALREQLDQRLSPIFPRISLRVAKSSSSIVQVSGTKNDEDKQRVMSIIESVWTDDSWLPE